MTNEQARSILRRVWGGSTTLTETEAKLIEAEERPGETALDTCQRIAGDTWDWRKHGSFSEENRRHFAAL